MRRFILLMLILFCVPASRALAQTAGPGRVDVVFCLDLSGSTNGLIDRVRDHVWDYTYSMSKCNPQLVYRFGIVGFSRPSFKRENGYVKVLKDLTTDMEAVASELFDLKSTVEKGDQLVGHALLACYKNISWSTDSSVVKVLFLVGNGLVNEGGTDFRKATQDLHAAGIVVNTLYCNTKTMNTVEIAGWKEIAELGKGYFGTFSVRSNYFTSTGTVDLKKLHALNDSLNNSYLYYGPIGKERWQMLRDLDRKIYFSNPQGYIYRSRFKISSLYQKKNSSWDMVDLHSVKGDLKYADFDPVYLPETLRKMQEAEWKKLVIQNKVNRTRLLSEIRTCIAVQDQPASEDPKSTGKKMLTFDTLTLKILNAILEKKGYVCEDKKP